MLLYDQNILITGAAEAHGVGGGTVEAVIEAGGRPIINGRNPDKLAAAAERHPEAITVQGDIAQATDVARIFSEIQDKVGTIHGLVNNAGVGLRGAAHECSEEQFDQLCDIDFRGTWLVTRAWLRQLLAQGDCPAFPAAAVNISSVHAHHTVANYALYAGTKGAVESMTRGLAVQYGAQGIRFNAVAPGYVHSAQNLELMKDWTDNPSAWVDAVINEHQVIRQPISPIDVGRVVVFLLSHHAASLTGQTLVADAGCTALLFPNGFIP